MSKRIFPILVICLATAGAAHAQYGGGGEMGGGMSGGHGGGHRGGGKRPPADPKPAPTAAPEPVHQTAPGKNEITGVIEAIDPAAGRVTISYGEVDALNWPAGTMPFVVSKPSLLDGASVGEKVRFHIESQQITDLRPWTPPVDDGASGAD